MTSHGARHGTLYGGSTDMEESSPSSNQLGRYRLVTTLGQGGMGTIWLAVAGGLGEFRKLLVVKELRHDLTRNHRFVEMFLDEAKLAARLNHPNVVQTIEAGQEDDRYFLAMEFLEGQSCTPPGIHGSRSPPGCASFAARWPACTTPTSCATTTAPTCRSCTATSARRTSS
jgi:serine/threonine protein kinase